MKLFGAGKPEHPMADRKAAQQLLQALPAHDGTALEQLGHWHESLAAAEGFKPEGRAQRLALVDEAAAPRLKKLERDYLATARAARGPSAQATVQWKRLHDYWRLAAQAHLRSLEGDKLVNAALPAMRALAQQLKWQQLRYGPIDTEVWGQANRVFALAEARGIAGAKPEYLKAAIFSAAAPDSLQVHELELAERIISDLAPGMAIGAAAAPQLPYWVDLARPMAPARGAKPPQPSSSLRFMGPGPALATLQGWIQRAQAQRQVPSELKLGADHDADIVLGVMRHLAMHWAPEAPERKHKRVAMDSRLKIAHGFDGVLKVLGGGSDSLDFGAGAAAESWKVENVSAGGFGALAPQAKSEWLKVGALLAAQPDNTGNWLIGTVRRVNKVSPSEVRVGVETLSRAPAVSQFALPNASAAPGVIMAGRAGEAAIALRAGVYVPGANLEAQVAGRHHVYMPQGVAERGDDYEIVRFREMVKES